MVVVYKKNIYVEKMYLYSPWSKIPAPLKNIEELMKG